MALSVKLIVSPRDGTLAKIETEATRGAPEKRVFFREDNGAYSYCYETAFRTEGSRARTYGTYFSDADFIIG